MFDALNQDCRRCGETAGARSRELAFNLGMWAVVGYRFRRWALLRPTPWPVRKFVGLVVAFVQLGIEMMTNITLPSTAAIGPGLYIAHAGSIVVGSKSVIGEFCTLTQGVTIGHAGGGGKSEAEFPRLGNRVYVGPGAILIGPIEIGDDALIGAGAVVTRSVPPRGVVAGNPARLLSLRGSFDLIRFPGMESNPSRIASIEAGLAVARVEPVGERVGA